MSIQNRNLTMREVSQLFNLSLSATYRLARDVQPDGFPKPARLGGKWLINGKKLAEWIEAQGLVVPEIPAGDSGVRP